MSPENMDDGAAKLTRKEIRARERARLEAELAAEEEAQAQAEAAQAAEAAAAAAAVAHPPLPAAPPASAVPEPAHTGYTHEAGHEEAAYQDHVQYVDQGHALPEDAHYAPSHYDPAHYEPVHPDGVHPDGLHPDGVHAGEVHHDAIYHDGTHHEDAHHAEPAFLGAAAVAAPSRKVRRRRRVLALFLSLAVFVTAIVVGVQFLRPLLGMDKISDYPGPGTGEVQVAVDPGEGTRSLASKLENAGVIADAGTFEGAFAASGKTLSPGEYSFREEMSNAGAIEVLSGEAGAKVVYFALNAGLRINESLTQIADGAGVNFSDLETLSNSPAQFGLPASAKNLEGFLAPGEYRFEIGTPAKEILQELVDVTVNELVAQGITDPAKQYEAVIVASIVQAEGGLADYGNVAGAIYNRLKPNDETNGYLQVDSAVTYGLGTKSFNFTEEQRADKSNPYNTYANPGLPPGPIGSPGKTAIDAAAKPASNDYLYWVTINLDSKETKFSSTLAEHNRYVDEYNAWCQANPGRCT
ncbi:endolytic transglycosylase MltG [Pseudarthrobacter sp. J75]|uniref:endolytic transglycosylase MltG n=1 Tax=unclassified Pseudarthrobacter TaxID=2647000 RepID=UPI002E800D59|nr:MULTISPECIES: endolytic transglycosylase MltG [unclassified Pseudarthrobacter]MEE2523379.1 endolytic transglycosylase MltG [Pseudarthrobacter sp. J47]MEE2529344.1 endolytic transglycosylase MltG [Pseudarthrobacter sp. J75]